MKQHKKNKRDKTAITNTQVQDLSMKTLIISKSDKCINTLGLLCSKRKESGAGGLCGGGVGTSPSQSCSGSKRPAFLLVFSVHFNDKKVDLALKLFAVPLFPSNKHQELPISV